MTIRDRRALVLGITVILGAWVCLRLVPRAVALWRDREESLSATHMLVAETRRALDELPLLEDSARTLTAEVVRLAPRILLGSTAAVAFSDLSGRLSLAADRHHGRLVRLTPLEDSTRAGSLVRVSGSAVFETDFHGLAELLTVLARDPVVTEVHSAEIAMIEGGTLTDEGPERLEVQIRISAWFLARRGES